MSLIFTKKIDDITFADIEEMVAQSTQESQVLDYKERFDNPKAIANLVSAMANTYGGYIIVGVAEKDDSNEPREIVKLQDQDKVLLSRVTNSCYENITPPVFVQTKIVKGGRPRRKVLVVKVPESDLTPHAVDNNTTVYIKVSDQKHPIAKQTYQKADLPAIEFLKQRRAGYVERRTSLVEGFVSRIEKAGVARKHGLFCLDTVVVPKYPRNELVNHSQLHRLVTDFLREFRSNRQGIIIGAKRLIHYDQGVISPASADGLRLSLDFNSFGACCCRITWERYAEEEEDTKVYLKLDHLGIYLVTLLSLSFGFLERCGFVGSVLVQSELSGIQGTKLLPDHPPGIGLSFGQGEGKCRLEDSIKLEGEYAWSDFSNGAQSFAVELLSRIIFTYEIEGDTYDFSKNVFDHGLSVYNKR